jgi:hypothetical protein
MDYGQKYENIPSRLEKNLGLIELKLIVPSPECTLNPVMAFEG